MTGVYIWPLMLVEVKCKEFIDRGANIPDYSQTGPEDMFSLISVEIICINVRAKSMFNVKLNVAEKPCLSVLQGEASLNL